jgi:hypothetical protein
MAGNEAASKLTYDEFSDAGPSPTKQDAFTTVIHIADSSAFNHKHAAMHADRVREELIKLMDMLPKSPIYNEMRDQIKIVIWNYDHEIKHFITAQADTESLVKHLRSHPAFKNEVAETGTMTNLLQGWIHPNDR